VPPRAAYNDQPVVVADLMSVIGQDKENLDDLGGREQQRGFGRYTLCPRCNNNTGSWYGPAYLEWVWHAVRVLAAAGGESSLYLPFRIFPLRVIKQIVTMFFASTHEGFREANPELARFVLNREAKGIDPEICIYAFLNPTPRARSSGVAGILTIGGGGSDLKIVNEIALAPVGYLMTLGSAAPDDRLVDITFFAKRSYNDWEEFWLRLPVLPVYTPFPGDYRPREEVLAAAKKAREEHGPLPRVYEVDDAEHA